MGKKRNNTSKEIKNQTKYSWQFWCIVSGFIAIIAMIILLLGLSIKAVVQDIQLISYKNKVEGTVSVAEFIGGQWEYDESGTGQRQKFDEVHYIITFDEEIAGYHQYEYYAKDIISTEKNVGDRYIVLFNTIENPKLIQKEDIMADNVIGLLFSILVVITIILRKRLYAWLTKISKKLDAFI